MARLKSTRPASRKALLAKAPKAVQEALEKWQALTGLSVHETRWSFEDFDLAGMNEELFDMLRLDPTGTSTYLLLECFLRFHLEDKTFSAAAILKDYAALTTYLAKAQALFALVQSDEATEIAATFRAKIRTALQHYQLDRGASYSHVLKLTDDANAMAFLRRDALQSMDQLRAYQFLNGAAGEGRPALYEHVYIAFNVNALLAQLRDMPQSGIAVVLMQDPQAKEHSYFAFALKNGGRIVLLTDKTQWANPSSAATTRRPDRMFAQRAWQNHFPYQILKPQTNQRGEIYFDAETSLVFHDQNLVATQRIADLEPAQILWIVMMLSLIHEKFWTQGWQPPALAYTGAMVKVQDQLISDAKGQPLPMAPGYQKIGLAPLTHEDVNQASIARQTERQPTGANAWIEARYKNQCDAALFNLDPAPPGMTLYLTQDGYQGDARGTRKKIAPAETTDPAKGAGSPSGALVPKPVLRVKQYNTQKEFFGEAVDRRYPLMALSATEFGTAEEIAADRLWIARANLAEHLSAAARHEYELRHDEIMAWYVAATQANLTALLDLCRADKLLETRIDTSFSGDDGYPKTANILRKAAYNDPYWRYKDMSGSSLSPYDKNVKPYGYRCVVSGVAARYRISLYPHHYSGLMLITGKKREELPDLLQHYSQEKPYAGNSILDRCDPVDTLDDPWQKHRMNMHLFLSRKAWIALHDGKPPDEPRRED